MKKRAQATIFIIIAIIVVVGAGTIMYFTGEFDSFIESKDKVIYSFVKDCMELTGTDIVYSIGSGGGYYFPPELSTESGVPIYYSKGKTYILTKEQIEEKISSEISNNLYFCVRDFVEFPEYEIEQGEIKVKTEIRTNQVILDIDYPLSIKKVEQTTTLNKFDNIIVPVRLGLIYDAVKEITQNQLENEKFLIDDKIQEAYCASCLSDIMDKYDLFLETIDYDEKTMVFKVIDEQSKVNDVAFYFQFANKYQIG